MTNIIKSIIAINPDAQVTVSADSIDKITWLHGTTPISKEDILAKQVELKAEYDTKQYQRDRTLLNGSDVYPAIEDQLDMIYHDQVNGTTTFKDAIKVVKDSHPKGGS